MPHSDGIDQHAREKLEKIKTFLRRTEEIHPILAELFLNAHTQHAHHDVELRVKSGDIAVAAHETGADMYLAIDTVIDKIITQIKKAKERNDDRHHKVKNDKNSFAA